MENNRNFPARQFHSLTFFAGLCIGITPVAQALAAEGQANAVTRWLSKHQRLRFMRHNNLQIRILASGREYYPHDDGDF